MKILKCGDKLLDLRKPKVMGILNVTPDSFYDGSKYDSVDKAISQVKIMVAEKVDVLDIGAASSRPGASQLSAEEEWQRLQPVLEEIVLQFPEILISVDTFWAYVAEKAVNKGVSIINDISAFSMDPKLLDFVAESHVPYVLMHMQGRPDDMQKSPQYENVVSEVMSFLLDKLELLASRGINDIVIDPGFGFGKTIDHNFDLFRKLGVMRLLDKPLLVGVSRKSMIYKFLGIGPEESLSATSALHLRALSAGAKILRVHDIKEAKQVIKLHEILNQ